MKLPSKKQWRQFFKILTKKERVSFFLLLFLFLASFSYLSAHFYYKKTEVVPAPGGEYIEGAAGFPRFINPVYAPLSDVDKDLTQLIFAGLMKHDSQGKLEPDLITEYKILEEGRVYEVYLKDNLLWQDGRPLTSDDVIFTIQTIQNAEVKSPLRSSWLGVEVERISENGLRFKLNNESSVFLENLTLKIIPKHIWENVPPQNFPLTPLNLNPVASGPYKLESLSSDRDGKVLSLVLARNPFYFGKKPYLEKIAFKFFESEEGLIGAFKLGGIKGFSLSSKTLIDSIPDSLNVFSFPLPRYFAVFFNQKNSKPLAEKEVRLALNYGTNKEEILDKVLSGRGKINQSPILPDFYGFSEPSEVYSFDIEKAKALLEKNGYLVGENGFREKIIKKVLAFQFKSTLRTGSQGAEVEELQKCLAKDSALYPEGEITGYFGQKTKDAVIRFQEKYKEDVLGPAGLTQGNGEVKELTRNKLNQVCFDKPEEIIPLKFSLVTIDQSPLKETAELLKEQWRELGVEVEIKISDINTLEREILRKRDFDSLLFGEALGAIPDPFPFWHSSQKGELGLNLANYENKDADKLLEDARKSLDENQRKEKLEKFQDVLIEDAPAVFLYNPYYFYFVSKEIKGIGSGLIIDPSGRFENFNNWYINTKRAWK